MLRKNLDRQATVFPQGAEQPITWENSGNLYQVDNHKAIVDMITGKIL
jgi:hypothetical protein